MEKQPKDSIFIKGARQNNLQNIDVIIPRDKLVVLTGLSGSGKSSLVNDIIYKFDGSSVMEKVVVPVKLRMVEAWVATVVVGE